MRGEGVHLTLKFLGELPEATVDELGRRSAEALRSLGAVEVACLQGRAHIYEMEAWAAALDDMAADLGVAREERPFAIHLTLARLDHPWPAPVAERFKAEVGRWSLPAYLATEVTLFQSDLQRGGAVYRVVNRFAVGGV